MGPPFFIPVLLAQAAYRETIVLNVRYRPKADIQSSGVFWYYMSMDIREAQPDDHPYIQKIVRAAFGQNTEADLVEALRESGDSVLELVADTHHQIVGHLLISRLRSPERCVALAPVAVLPSSQGRGVGSKLIRAAVAETTEHGWLAMFVLGEPEYYSRFGFSVEACANFESDYPKAFMMALELKEGSLKSLSGRIAYADAFKDED